MISSNSTVRWVSPSDLPCEISACDLSPSCPFLISLKSLQGGPFSVRLRFGGGTVPAAPTLEKGNFCVSAQVNRKGRFGFRIRFLKDGSSGFGFQGGKARVFGKPCFCPLPNGPF